MFCVVVLFFFFKQKTAYEMRISDWSSDVCSSDLLPVKGYASGHFHFLANTPIKRVEDLAGKRIRSYGWARVKMYELLDISPIFMSYADIYEGIERGEIGRASCRERVCQYV